MVRRGRRSRAVARHNNPLDEDRAPVRTDHRLRAAAAGFSVPPRRVRKTHAARASSLRRRGKRQNYVMLRCTTTTTTIPVGREQIDLRAPEIGAVGIFLASKVTDCNQRRRGRHVGPRRTVRRTQQRSMYIFYSVFFFFVFIVRNVSCRGHGSIAPTGRPLVGIVPRRARCPTLIRLVTYDGHTTRR